MKIENPFWFRAETPGTRHAHKQNKEVDKKSISLRNAPSTLFDLEKYFSDTDRGHYIRNIGSLNTGLLEKALMNDLKKTEEPEKRKFIRSLLLIALTGGFPNPEFDKNEILKVIYGRIRSLHWEYMRKSEAGDDMEPEEKLLSDWRRIAAFLNKGHQIYEEDILTFIEGYLDETQKNIEYNKQSRYTQNIYEKLRQVRTALYHYTVS